MSGGVRGLAGPELLAASLPGGGFSGFISAELIWSTVCTWSPAESRLWLLVPTTCGRSGMMSAGHLDTVEFGGE